jgi:SnoaL-like domain
VPHDREQVLAFARSYTDAWCSGEPARVVDHFAPGATIAVNGGAATPILDVAESFMAAFPDVELQMGGVVIRDDDIVEYHWTLIGDHSETGSHVHISGFEEWTMGDDGLVVASRGNFDAVEYDRQVAHGVGSAG